MWTLILFCSAIGLVLGCIYVAGYLTRGFEDQFIKLEKWPVPAQLALYFSACFVTFMLVGGALLCLSQ